MIKKQENEVMEKKPYVSVWLEKIILDGKDVVTTSDPLKDEDITQDYIFSKE